MTEDNSRRRRSILPLVIGLPLITVVAVVAIVLTYSGNGNQAERTPPSQGGSGEQATSPSTTAEPEEQAGLGTPTLGRADAPVVMMEFSDYQ